MTPEPETIVWIAADTPPYHEGASAGCNPSPVPDRTLPKGLRGVAKPAREECGKGWMFVRFDPPGSLSTRGQSYYVPTSAIVTAAPRPAWDKTAATGTAWTRQAGDKPTLGVPLDDLTWTSPALVPGGQPVERLGSEVIRTLSGHELWVDPYYLGEVDPLGRSDYSASRESVPNRKRLSAGLKTHEANAPITWLPPAAALGPAQRGRAYAWTMRAEWLSAPRYTPEWFDPIGQSLEHECGKAPRPGEPCGHYPLDYTAFGAWLPTKEVELLGVWTGTGLQVLVIEPWGNDIAVSPGWSPD